MFMWKGLLSHQKVVIALVIRSGALHQISRIKATERFRFPPLLICERQRKEPL